MDRLSERALTAYNSLVEDIQELDWQLRHTEADPFKCAIALRLEMLREEIKEVKESIASLLQNSNGDLT